MSKSIIDKEKIGLQFENEDYELHKPDEKSLQYVVLKREGQEKIAKHYKEKYGVEMSIAVCEISLDVDYRAVLFGKICEIANYLENDQAKGLVFTKKYTRQNYREVHATPYIIAKSNDRIIIVEFQNSGDDILAKWMRETNRAVGFDFCKVTNFENRQISPAILMQKGGYLCATFAINVLKQSLADPEFIKKILGFNSKVSISNIKFGQGDDFIDRLSEEQSEKYVRDFDGEKNFAAWYNAHRHAVRLNQDHLDFLDKPSKEVFEDIDRVRKEYKEKKEIQLKSLEKLGVAELTKQP